MSREPRSCWVRPLNTVWDLSVPPGNLAQPGKPPALARSREKLLLPHLRQRIQHQSQLGSFSVLLECFSLQLHPLGLRHPDGLDHKSLRFSNLADLFCLRLSKEDFLHPGEGNPALQQPGSPQSTQHHCPPSDSHMPAPRRAHELVFAPTSPQPSAKPGSGLGQAMGSLTSRPRRSVGCGRLQPRPAASQWRSAPSPFG